MVDPEDSRLKSEIDQIMKNIDDTMKKIESVVPLKKGSAEADEGADSQENSQSSQIS